MDWSPEAAVALSNAKDAYDVRLRKLAPILASRDYRDSVSEIDIKEAIRILAKEKDYPLSLQVWVTINSFAMIIVVLALLQLLR